MGKREEVGRGLTIPRDKLENELAGRPTWTESARYRYRYSQVSDSDWAHLPHHVDVHKKLTLYPGYYCFEESPLKYS